MPVIYTAIVGKLDILCWPPKTRWDKICYTDLEFFGESQYQVVEVELKKVTRRKRQRQIKIFWPEILDNYDYSFYLDSNVKLKADPAEFIKFLQPGSDILVYKHPAGDCLYGEAWLVTQPDIKMAGPKTVAKQIAKYRKDGYPEHNGLFACTVILRRHTEKIREFSKDWWKEVKNYSQRDQISFPYVVWKHNLKVSTFPGGTLYNNPFFKLGVHSSGPVLSFKDDLSQTYIYGWRNEQKLLLRDTAKRIAELFEFPVLVNIGVEYGGSMYCMRLGAPKARLMGVDIRYLKNVELSPLNAELIEGNSNRVHTEVTEPIHMILIDGGHDYETVRGDILGWLDKVVIGGVALFHDVELPGVSKAINDHLPKEWVSDKYIRGPFDWTSGLKRYWKS